jgi:uncharacterized repeat protein (TIGR01451 family)
MGNYQSSSVRWFSADHLRSRLQRRWRTMLHWLVVLMQILTTVGSVTLATFQPTLPTPLAPLQPLIGEPKVAQAAGNVTGIVFQDFDFDGVRDTSGIVDIGVGGVTVTAYTATGGGAGTVVATATTFATVCLGNNNPAGQGCTAANTPALGSYTLNLAAVPNSTPLRIEFTSWDSAVYQPGPIGTNNSTSVRFLTATSGAQSNIDFGLVIPCEYCQANPPALTPLLIVGPYTGTFANNTAAIRYAYNSTGQVPSTPGVNAATAARHSQIGSTYGVAAHKESDTYYVSAFYRRGAGFGPNGPGAIYSISAANAVAHYATIPNAGAGTHDFSRNPITDIWYDAPGVVGNPATGTVSQPGKVSLGDIEISNDGTQMYVVNLNDRNLYRLPATSATIPVPAGDVVSVGDISTVNLSGTGYNCAAAEIRPFALAFDTAGELYVGAVCSGETRPPTTLPYASASDYPWAYILRFDDPGFTPVFDFPINFERHTNLYHSRWTDNIIQNNFGGDTGNVTIPGDGTTVLSNQPLLADLVFERRDMVISFRARGIDQTWANGAHTSTSILVRACTTNGLTWALENAGVCSGVTGAAAGVGYGPGDGLFYDVEDNADDEGRVAGGLALYPGGDLLVAYNDPFDTQSGGMARFRNRAEGATAAGTLRQGYELMDNGSGSGITGSSGYMGKGSGIGDIELLCDSAPLQIGNRVWNDTDGDGIQDPGEPGLANVSVSLIATNTTTVLATATTDANGNYYFSSATGTNTASARYGITGLTPNTSGFIIRTSMTQTNLSDYRLTLANADGSANGDARDSDATLNGGYAEIVFDTGEPGANDHSYDIGLYEVYSVGNRVWNDANNNGLFASPETGINGVILYLYRDLDNDGTITGSELLTPTATTATDSDGYYRFDELRGGNYLIEIPGGANFDLLGSGALAGFRSSTGGGSEPAPDPDTDAGDSDDNGSETAGANSAVRSLVFTLGPTGASEPTTETDIGPGDETTIDDAHTNLTVDFGFYLNLQICATGNNDLGGTVFRDFNANGVKESTDTRIAGVLVRAYDVNNTLVATTTVRADGSYLFPGLLGTTSPVRIEFSNLPAGYEPSSSATTGATQRGTATQFYSAPFCAANFAANLPASYCQDNPLLCTSLFINGDPLQNGSANWPGMLLAVPNSGGNVTYPLASGAQVGALWGQAWQATTRKLYSAAAVRRHAGLGPQGLGGIYVTNLAGTATTSNFVDLENAPFNINLGNLPDNGLRGLPASATTANTDPQAYGAVGKQGMGDLDLSEDGNTLWAVNLNNRSLVKLDVTNGATPTAAQEFTFSNMGEPSCTGGVLRPWGLKFYAGQGFVGAVCTAETSGLASDLRAYVFSFDPVAPTSLTTVLSFPLNYIKGYAFSPFSPNSNRWYPWTDTYADALMDGGVVYAANSRQGAHPTPILSDIEFDTSGAMILGFVDRFGMQIGSLNLRPAGGAGTIAAVSGGDILRACPNTAGAYVLESGGACGGITGGGANGQGPGNGEFYSGDGITIGGTAHQETSDGGLALIPGGNRVALPAMDPTGNSGTGGIVWLSNATGARVQSSQIFALSQPATMGKAVGLGDLEYLCDAAPIEIGNRVWRDSNNNGIQDPNESPIAGVIITLQVATRTITATTNALGEYYFSSIVSTTVPGASRVNGISQLTPNTPFTLTINPAQTPLTGLALTTANADGQTDNDPITDGRDSDGQTVGNLYRIVSTTEGPGSNNHSYDWGFNTPPLRDWGDLPDGNAVTSPNYNTDSTGTAGPSHVIIPGLRMGATVDAEMDGQPNATATGDDITGTPDDEDSVVVPSFTAGSSAAITVTVVNTTGQNATLYGFIDFNGDGDFNDGGEAVTAPANSSGPVILTFSVPLTAATSGQVGARFRLSTQAGLGPDGPAADGEVEDYLITINPSPIYDLALVKVANPSSVVAGDNVTYTIRIKNQGAAAGGLYSVTDRLPTGFTFVSASDGGSHSSGVVTWSNLPSLAAGATKDLTLVATVSVTPGSYTNWAEISADSGDDEDSTPDTNTGQDNTLPNDLVIDRTALNDVNIDPSPGDEDDNDPATVTVTPAPQPSYVLGKRLDTVDPVRIGEEVIFTIQVTNTGNITLAVLPLLDLYSTAHLSFLSAIPAPDDGTDDGDLAWNDLTASFGQDLPPNGSFAVQLRFRAAGDTTLLPGGATSNVARSENAQTTTGGSVPHPPEATAPVRIVTPTSVELAAYSAHYAYNHIILAWQTVSEAEAIGFHLLRLDLSEPGATWVKLNPTMIEAQQAGQANGASYTFTDRTLTPGRNYRYVLEIVSISGESAYRELGLVSTGGNLFLPVIER